MKIYFNTKAFDCLDEKHKLNIASDCREADMAVLGAKTIPFKECSQLKAVYRFGVGRENIPDDILEKNKPPVYFPSDKTKKVLFEATANFTVFLINYMYYSNKIGTTDPWKKYTRDYFSDKKLLIIGIGNIGKLVSDKMINSMRVSTFDIRFNKDDEIKLLIEESDIITLHIPMSEKTRSFIDAEKLSWMKDDAVLVNTARGALVDEDALYEKIKKTDFRAAFDVFWKEPYNGKLKELDRSKFFMTPHTSSQTIEYVREGFNDIKQIIKEFSENEYWYHRTGNTR